MMKFSNMTNESSNINPFSLGLDFHGVIDALPKEFSFLTNSIVSFGGEVHIITGGSWTKELEDQVNNSGVVWTHKFSIYDYLVEKNEHVSGKIQFPDGSIQVKFSSDVWDKAKSDYCRQHKISLHLDDTLIYNDYFTTPFARLWSHNNKPKSSSKDFRYLQ